MTSFPDYNELPMIETNGQSKRCAWGLFDKDGKKDVFGCLNKVTPDVVARAAAEVRDGVTISLNEPLRITRRPGVGRKGLVHEVISFVDSPLGIHGFDDEVEFNTQCSSQWDSLCHFFDQDLKRGYNDASPEIDDLVQDWGEEDKNAAFPTLEHWHSRGGLATRGVLIDYKAYADSKGIQYSPFSPHKITIPVIEEIAKTQNVNFRPGDLFLLRTGYTEAMKNAKDDEEGMNMANAPDAIGVEGTIEAVEWFWNKHFSGVAADNMGFEVMVPTKDGVEASGGVKDCVLHPHLISLLGIHIGELWNLTELSEYCHKTGRFSFMLTTMPLNVPGCLGSPPNAMAIF